MAKESRRATFLDNADLIQITNGRTLATYTCGSGEDVVLFEAGGASSCAYWGLVIEALSDMKPSVRAVAYNRAGYGLSTTAWDKRTLHDLVADLSEVISRLTFRRLVLVGHSWGGPIIRAAAAGVEPSRLAGLVLVDATDELCDDYYGDKGRQFYWNSWKMVPRALTGTLAHQKSRQLKLLPEPYREAAIADSTSLRGAWAGSYEVANIEQGLLDLLSDPLPTNGRPMTLISGQLSGRPDRGRGRSALNAAHQRRATLTGENGRYVPANESGHAIFLTEPGLIAREIHRLL